MNVLLLGDSHTHGYYGQALEALFKAAGHNVTRVGWVGANAGHYLSGGWKKLTQGGTGDFDAAKAGSYDLAVVTLGTNDAAWITPPGGPATATAKAIRQLASQIKAKDLWWVGPPSFEANKARTYNPVFATDDLNARSDRLWKAASPLFPKRAIDPRAATRPYARAADIHFDQTGGDAWARYVYGVVTDPKAAAPGISTGTIVAVLGGLVAVGGVLWWLSMARRKAQSARALPASRG